MCCQTIANAKRPQWEPRIMGDKLKDGLLGSIKDEIWHATCGQDHWCNLLFLLGTHLCHVMPRAAIDHIIDKKKIASERNKFIELLFQIDNDAFTVHDWKNSTTGFLTSKKPSSKHLKSFPIPENMIKYHELYFRDGNESTLFKANTEMKDEALKACKNSDKQKCKSLLNSAPANLRWGFGGVNVIISDRLDLMGNEEGEITKKEQQLMEWYKFYLKKEDWGYGNMEYYHKDVPQHKYGASKNTDLNKPKKPDVYLLSSTARGSKFPGYVLIEKAFCSDCKKLTGPY